MSARDGRSLRADDGEDRLGNGPAAGTADSKARCETSARLRSGWVEIKTVRRPSWPSRLVRPFIRAARVRRKSA